MNAMNICERCMGTGCGDQRLHGIFPDGETFKCEQCDGLGTVENPLMAKTVAERQADFKQAMREAGFVRLEAYVTKEQREKFRRLGGDEWLRKKIDSAKEKK